MQNLNQNNNLESYLQSSEQLAAVLYPGDVKQLIDGSVGQFRAKLCVSLDGIQDLVFILGSSHLKKGQGHRFNPQNTTYVLWVHVTYLNKEVPLKQPPI